MTKDGCGVGGWGGEQTMGKDMRKGDGTGGGGGGEGG